MRYCNAAQRRSTATYVHSIHIVCHCRLRNVVCMCVRHATHFVGLRSRALYSESRVDSLVACLSISREPLQLYCTLSSEFDRAFLMLNCWSRAKKWFPAIYLITAYSHEKMTPTFKLLARLFLRVTLNHWNEWVDGTRNSYIQYHYFIT